MRDILSKMIYRDEVLVYLYVYLSLLCISWFVCYYFLYLYIDCYPISARIYSTMRMNTINIAVYNVAIVRGCRCVYT